MVLHLAWFLVELEFGNVGFWGEGKTGVLREKPPGAKERINNKLNPRMASTSGFEPGPHWWETSTLTTALSLDSQNQKLLTVDDYCGSLLSPKVKLNINFVIAPGRDFAQKAKSRGGTLVTRAYIKESNYSWNIQSVCQKKSRFAWTGAARNRWVMMTFLLFAPASTKWLGWRKDMWINELLSHLEKCLYLSLSTIN